MSCPKASTFDLIKLTFRVLTWKVFTFADWSNTTGSKVIDRAEADIRFSEKQHKGF